MVSLFLAMPLLAQAQKSRETNLIQTLIMIGVFILFFYFILWRPERKRRKHMEHLRNAMKKGDRVTAMGIVGTVDKVEEKTVILKMIDGAKIEVLKQAITEVQPSGGQEEKKEAPTNQ